MNSKSVPMKCDCGWDAIANITKKPEMILYLFPFCKDFKMSEKGINVEFDVKKFIMNFKFDFSLRVEIDYPFIRYIFTGKRGKLVISFHLNEKTEKLKIEVSWEGMGEKLMDKQLKEFAEGIKKALEQIQEQYINTEYLIKDMIRGGAKVKDVSPMKMPSILKYFYAIADERSFTILGSGEKGDFFRIKVDNGVVKGCTYIKEGKKYKLDINKEVMYLEWSDFKGMKPKGDYFLKIEE